jgi:hypothetical protein
MVTTWETHTLAYPESFDVRRPVLDAVRDLRRESGSQLYESGSALHEVAGVLGHANVLTTNAYLSSSIKQQRAAMLRRDALRASGFAQDSHNPPPTPPEDDASDRANSLN